MKVGHKFVAVAPFLVPGREEHSHHRSLGVDAQNGSVKTHLPDTPLSAISLPQLRAFPQFAALETPGPLPLSFRFFKNLSFCEDALNVQVLTTPWSYSSPSAPMCMCNAHVNKCLVVFLFVVLKVIDNYFLGLLIYQNMKNGDILIVSFFVFY